MSKDELPAYTEPPQPPTWCACTYSTPVRKYLGRWLCRCGLLRTNRHTPGASPALPITTYMQGGTSHE
jgi:hypothetical protein